MEELFLDDLSSLQCLDMFRLNALSTLNLQHLTSLRHVKLCSSKINTLHVSYMPHLETLDLKSFFCLKALCIEECPALKDVKLKHCFELKDLILKKLQKLESCAVYCCGKLQLLTFEDCDALEKVELALHKLASLNFLGCDRLATLKGSKIPECLTSLTIAGSSFHNLDGFENFRDLKCLIINSPALQDITPLMQLPNLLEASISGDLIPQRQIDALQSFLEGRKREQQPSGFSRRLLKPSERRWEGF